MNIPKHVVVSMLRERGKNARADFVDRDLPDSIDTYKHHGLLATLDLRVEDLIAATPSNSDQG